MANTITSNYKAANMMRAELEEAIKVHGLPFKYASISVGAPGVSGQNFCAISVYNETDTRGETIAECASNLAAKVLLVGAARAKALRLEAAAKLAEADQLDGGE